MGVSTAIVHGCIKSRICNLACIPDHTINPVPTSITVVYISPTIITDIGLQQPNLFQVLGRVHWQGQRVTHGLVKARVGARAVLERQVPVLQEILDVAELVVGGHQVIVRDVRALFHPTKEHSLRSVFPYSWAPQKALNERVSCWKGLENVSRTVMDTETRDHPNM